MRIGMDAMGGAYAPREIVRGALELLGEILAGEGKPFRIAGDENG